MKISIKVNKKVKDADICEFQEIGTVTLTQSDLEAMALAIFKATEEVNNDKFEYTAAMDLIETD